MTRVLCLCCGAWYSEHADCGNYDPRTHTAQRAWEVARYLAEHGCEHPRPLDVRYALSALDSLSAR